MARQRQWSVEDTASPPNGGSNGHTTSRNKRWFTGRYGFKGNDSAVKAEQRRDELKSKILAGVRDFNLEKYCKSDDELKLIRNTQVRAYYEAQNPKLNDWAEVDSLVWSLADDIIDSTDPDADHDGIIDNNAPLYSVDYDLEAFLPSESDIATVTFHKGL